MKFSIKIGKLEFIRNFVTLIALPGHGHQHVWVWIVHTVLIRIAGVGITGLS